MNTHPVINFLGLKARSGIVRAVLQESKVSGDQILKGYLRKCVSGFRWVERTGSSPGHWRHYSL